MEKKRGKDMEQFNTMLEEVLKYLGRKDCIFVDLRTKEEYGTGHLRGAINIPYDDLEQEKKRLYGYRNIYLYCDRGNLSLLASRDLKKEGFPVVNLWGGIQTLLQEIAGRDKKFIDSVWEKN